MIITFLDPSQKQAFLCNLDSLHVWILKGPLWLGFQCGDNFLGPNSGVQVSVYRSLEKVLSSYDHFYPLWNRANHTIYLKWPWESDNSQKIFRILPGVCKHLSEASTIFAINYKL